MELLKVKEVSSEQFGDIPLGKGDSTLRPSSTTRETKEAEKAANTGYTESQQHAVLSVNVQAFVGPEEYANANPHTYTVRCGHRSYSLPGAWVIGATEIGDGTFTIEVHAPRSIAL